MPNKVTDDCAAAAPHSANDASAMSDFFMQDSPGCEVFWKQRLKKRTFIEAKPAG
jgi:hypothetical protein